MSGQNKYILTDRSRSLKAPVWVLRKDPFIETKEGLKQIRYVKGAHTIFADKLDAKLPSTTLEFHDGTLTVPKADKLLNEFLQSHPEYNKNFKLFDPEADARKELEIEDLIDDAKAKLKLLKANEREAIAVTLFGDSATRNSTDEQIRLKLHQYIKATDKNGNLKEVESGKSQAKHFIALCKDPSIEVKYLVIEAQRKDIIRINAEKTAVQWSDGGVIIPVAAGQSPISKMTELLLSKEGETTLQELALKLGVNNKSSKK